MDTKKVIHCIESKHRLLASVEEVLENGRRKYVVQAGLTSKEFTRLSPAMCYYNSVLLTLPTNSEG